MVLAAHQSPHLNIYKALRGLYGQERWGGEGAPFTLTSPMVLRILTAPFFLKGNLAFPSHQGSGMAKKLDPKGVAH